MILTHVFSAMICAITAIDSFAKAAGDIPQVLFAPDQIAWWAVIGILSGVCFLVNILCAIFNAAESNA